MLSTQGHLDQSISVCLLAHRKLAIRKERLTADSANTISPSLRAVLSMCRGRHLPPPLPHSPSHNAPPLPHCPPSPTAPPSPTVPTLPHCLSVTSKEVYFILMKSVKNDSCLKAAFSLYLMTASASECKLKWRKIPCGFQNVHMSICAVLSKISLLVSLLCT